MVHVRQYDGSSGAGANRGRLPRSPPRRCQQCVCPLARATSTPSGRLARRETLPSCRRARAPPRSSGRDTSLLHGRKPPRTRADRITRRPPSFCRYSIRRQFWLTTAPTKSAPCNATRPRPPSRGNEACPRLSLGAASSSYGAFVAFGPSSPAIDSTATASPGPQPIPAPTAGPVSRVGCRLSRRRRRCPW